MKRLFRLAFVRLSVFSAVSVSCGAVAGFCSQIWDADPWLFVTLGALLPVGPMTGYFSSSRALRRSIAKWKEMMEDGLLTERQFQRLRQAAVDWYSGRWFGKSDVAEEPPGEAAEE
jgi:hypothetical protein